MNRHTLLKMLHVPLDYSCYDCKNLSTKERDGRELVRSFKARCRYKYHVLHAVGDSRSFLETPPRRHNRMWDRWSEEKAKIKIANEWLPIISKEDEAKIAKWIPKQIPCDKYIEREKLV